MLLAAVPLPRGGSRKIGLLAEGEIGYPDGAELGPDEQVVVIGGRIHQVQGEDVLPNTKPMKVVVERDGLEIRYYSVIYDLTDDIKSVLSGLLAPEVRETFLGYAEVREVFSVSKVGKVAGCMITEGTVKRGAKVRLLRDDTVIHEGDLSQLKRFKDDAKEVQSGTECGMALANYQDIQVGDIIECFETEEVAREL